jgi:YEATS domain-containing protein 1/3
MSGNKLLLSLQIGHVAALKTKKDMFGMTHDWQLYVRGSQGDGSSYEISHFIDKVVFNLHDSFPKPKRTVSILFLSRLL